MFKSLPNPFKKEMNTENYIVQSSFISSFFLSYYLFLMFGYVTANNPTSLTVIGVSFLICVVTASLSFLFVLIILSLIADLHISKATRIIYLICGLPLIFIFMLILSLGFGPYNLISAIITVRSR